MNALIGLCLAVLATSASGALTPPSVCGECKEFVRNLGGYLKTDGSLKVQVGMLDLACQEQKTKADEEAHTILEDLKKNLGDTKDLGENMMKLQEAAYKDAEAQRLRYSVCRNKEFLNSWSTLAPVINEEFFGKQAERVCTQIGECGKFSASDCMGDCACRISKIADVFQTGPTQNAINGFLMQNKAKKEDIDLAILGMSTCATGIKKVASQVCQVPQLSVSTEEEEVPKLALA